jgi:cobalt-zinc-cadmium efflux system membrane fusion protein
MNTIRFFSVTVGIMMGVTILQSCGSNRSPEPADPDEGVPTVSNNGEEITFGLQSPQLQQFTVDTVRETSMNISVSAPVHNLVSVVKSDIFDKKLYFFETPDVTDLYSSYLTSMATLEHSSLALQRTKDLYAHGIAAAKDLQDAEEDYASNQSNLADNITRLRAVGIDPKYLEQTNAGSVWAIADISEEQMTDIKPYTKAELEYDAYPCKQFVGRIASIGEVIDPTTRKVKVRINLTNPDGELHPGMFGKAYFFEGPWKVVAIPTTAVVREGDGTMTVWVTTDHLHFEKTKVKIGMQANDVYQIIEGLQPGEQIVARGGIFLSNMAQAPPTD